MDTDDWSERLRDDCTRRLEEIARMQDQMDHVYGEAEAARGLVRVRVTPAGRPTRLHLDPGATRLPADELAGHVLAALDAATRRAAERLQAILGELVPTEDLDALVRGTVTERDRAAVREELDAWQDRPEAFSPGRGWGAWGAS